MEAIFSIIGVAVAYFIFITVVKGIFAGGKAVVTGQSFKEAYRGLDDFKVRIKDEKETFDGAEEPTEIKRIQMKGLLPINRPSNLTSYLYVRDITDQQNPKPVISHVDSWREPASPCFLQEQEMGHFDVDVGFKDWINLGAVIPKAIQPPQKGQRDLEVVFLLMDSSKEPFFAAGSILNLDEIRGGLFAFERIEFSHYFEQKGYEDSSKDADKARGLTIKIAMAVAMSDGSLDDAEGHAIKDWIKKSISHLSEERQSYLKKIYNKALKDSYELAKENKLPLSKLTKQLNDLDEEGIKYEAMSLCYEIMAADGVASKDELKTVRRIGEALELDVDELSNMRDKVLINVSQEDAEGTSSEEILGIDPSWDNKKINKHLLDNFRKWNSRIQTLSEGQERESAQRMLDRIAELRKKYGS